MSGYIATDLTFDGLPIVVYEDGYPGFSGLACYENVGVPAGGQNALYCHGAPNVPNRCGTVTEHILHYMKKVKDNYHLNGYGPRNGTLPMIYLNGNQGLLFKREIAAGMVPGRRIVQVATSVICTKCRFKNDFGEANQKDGSYVCYMCR